MYKKNDFVIHLKRPEWGTGIVFESPTNDTVKVSFEDVAEIKTLRLTDPPMLLATEPSSSSRIFLENLCFDLDNPKVRFPLPLQMKKFVEQFKGGFYGEMYAGEERSYKVEAHQLCVELLNDEMMAKLIAEENWTELAARIKKVFSKTNLLASFELIKVGNALKAIEAQKEVSQRLFNLMYGQDAISRRFEETVNSFSKYELDKWPIITYFLFLRFPEEYMFVKPTMTKEAAQNRGFDIQYDSKVNFNTYDNVQRLSRNLWDKLAETNNKALLPRDMIDIQSFMWITFASGWSSEELKKAQLKYKDNTFC